jgi:formylmethanofuran dehydrogenase subunit E
MELADNDAAGNGGAIFNVGHLTLEDTQVLGVRMGLDAGELLGSALPQADKCLYTIVETDGCAADGIAVASNCWVGRRTLHIEDCGKVAATFEVVLRTPVERLIGRPGRKAICAACGEETSSWGNAAGAGSGNRHLTLTARTGAESRPVVHPAAPGRPPGLPSRPPGIPPA